jgi:predicted DNA-binding transcriptional regulator AlpA
LWYFKTGVLMRAMHTNTHLRASEFLAVTAAELAKKLQISERHLWTLHEKGLLGPMPFKLGRSTRWYTAEVEKWLAAGAPDRETWKKQVA